MRKAIKKVVVTTPSGEEFEFNSTAQAAEFLNVSKYYLYNVMKDGRLVHSKYKVSWGDDIFNEQEQISKMKLFTN